MDMSIEEDGFKMDVGIEKIVELLKSNDSNIKETRNDEHRTQQTIKEEVDNEDSNNTKKLQEDGNINNKICCDKQDDIATTVSDFIRDNENENKFTVVKEEIPENDENNSKNCFGLVSQATFSFRKIKFNLNKKGNRNIDELDVRSFIPNTLKSENNHLRRKRGRPRIRPLISTIRKQQENNQNAQGGVRRKRGRPRIRPLTIDVNKANQNTGEEPKMQINEAQVEKVRRRRGRPRIRPLTISLIKLKQEYNQDTCQTQGDLCTRTDRPTIEPLNPDLKINQDINTTNKGEGKEENKQTSEANKQINEVRVETVRRKRGRPRIRPLTIPLIKLKQEYNQDQAQGGFRRRRGRPRIRPLKINQEQNNQDTNLIISKTKEEAKNQMNEIQLEKVVRRKRGRPRIRPLKPSLKINQENNQGTNEADEELYNNKEKPFIPFMKTNQEYNEDAYEIGGVIPRRSRRSGINQHNYQVADEAKTVTKICKTRGRPRIRQLFKPIFKCCSVTFTKRARLFSHMEQAQFRNDDCQPVYVCIICSAKFNLYLDLYCHCKEHPGLIVPKHRFFCGRCFHLYSNLWCVKKHQMATTECQSVISPPRVKGFLDLKTDFENYCSSTADGKALCNSFIVNVPYTSDRYKPMKMKNLNTNMFYHANDNYEYRCDICYDIFNEIEELEEHERLHEEMSTSTSSDMTLYNETEIEREASTQYVPNLLTPTKSNIITLRSFLESSRKMSEANNSQLTTFENQDVGRKQSQPAPEDNTLTESSAQTKTNNQEEEQTETLSTDIINTRQELNLETDNIVVTIKNEHAEFDPEIDNIDEHTLSYSSNRILQMDSIEMISNMCFVCSEKFNDHKSLKHHKAKAKLENHCDHCNYFTCLRSNLKNHYLMAHNTKHFCEFCLLIFNTEQDFDTHNKFHVCPKCKQSYVNLVQHLEESQECVGDIDEENSFDD
ncbi:hypothetical protein ILUMI_26635 [Ignelater luminosus]|uniref:C2H2-type domain-containing protein n=1 Tax=Ignelater luminosus TaxID=2038154 RepID=A0A8K0C6C2_IGNLU|nr:hypothetical protein ILUMI_26635 [Ignelater luminosus]